MNGTSIAYLSRDDLISLVIDGKTLRCHDSQGVKVVIIPQGTHERLPDYDKDKSGRTYKHLIAASLNINELATSGVVLFQKHSNREYLVTIRYYPYPQFSE